jgi:Fibronectin type III domain/Divergent InlB B-repeat domain
MVLVCASTRFPENIFRTPWTKVPVLFLSVLFFMALGLGLSPLPSYAGQATLTWDPDTSTTITGYRINYGTTSGSYAQKVDVGYATSYTLGNLSDGQTYYFVVAAYDAAGDQSGYSNEVSKSMPIPQDTLTISKTGTGTGTVSGTGISCGATCTDTYNQGTVVTLTATADAGSTFAGWSGSGCSGTGQCTVSMNAATPVTATFNANVVTYSITATTNGSGTITALNNSNVSQATSGSSTITTVKVNSGASQSFSITPSAGYNISNVTVDGTSVGAVASYTFSNITANHTIAATFAATAYSITSSAGTGGSISPSGTLSISSGGSQAFSITPSVGYRVAGVTVDGVSVGAVASYTFSNITANHTIAATFTATPYSIKASAGTGGSISPSGTSTISSGGSQTFAIFANHSYKIAAVIVDGVSVGAITSYSFANVQANHTITVSFSANKKK